MTFPDTGKERRAMPKKSARGGIRTRDVSGTFIAGDNNRVTNTTHRPEQPRQHNSAEDQAAVFAVGDGTMHVTYNADTDTDTDTERETER